LSGKAGDCLVLAHVIIDAAERHWCDATDDVASEPFGAQLGFDRLSWRRLVRIFARKAFYL
jgi:hypothetical protein